MAGTLKTSQFNSATVANPTDEVPLLQGGQLKRVQVKVLTGNPDVGWQASGESWTFSSWNSSSFIGVVNVPSDATTKYAAGMFVRFIQATGGTKYGVILSVTATTLSIWFGVSLYTLTNEAITTSVYSPLEHPVGLPVQIADGMPYAFSVYRNAAGGTVGNDSFGIVPYDSKEYDNTNGFSTGAFTYTAPVAGIYYFEASVQYVSVAGSTILITSLLVNSTSAETKRLDEVIIGGGNITRKGSCQLKLAAGDIVRVGARGSGNAVGASAFITYFTGHLLSR